MSIKTDYQRLYVELPQRGWMWNDRDERTAKRNAVKLFSDVKKNNHEWSKTALVDRDAKNYISRVLDASVLRVYNESVILIQGTNEHVRNYNTLVSAPKNCGGFKKEKAILSNATPFEQMVAFDHWIYDKESYWLKGRRTICFSVDDEVIPIYVSKRSNTKATTMTTILGVSRGKNKAPRYTELAANQALAESSIFTEPLECLEIVRQPHFSAATILKGNAWHRNIIDHRRRYEVTDIHDGAKNSQFACVELVGQNKTANSPTKEASAATNLISLLKKNRNEPVNRVLQYEELVEEGYNDDAEISVTPKQLWSASEKAVTLGDVTELDDLMRKLFVTEIGGFSSPVVQNYYADHVFTNE